MKKKILLINAIIIFIVLLGQVSYAAVSIVPGTDVMVNISSTDAYLSCRNMKNTGESLYGTTVEPHLTTNADWGAVSYLSNSAYGTNTEGENTGILIDIDGTNYYSTNGNITGVMNWGSNPNKTLYTKTSCISQAYLDSETNDSNMLELKNEAKQNSRFVDVFNNPNVKGTAMAETVLICSAPRAFQNQVTSNHSTGSRVGLFGYCFGAISGVVDWSPVGGAGTSTNTFRPIIWNK